MEVRGSQLERGFVIGGYRIDELISRGGMGVVYRATNVALNRIYALKVLAPELAGDEAFRERFKREMRIAASITNPNVVGIHYAGEQDGLLFFVMDFIHGTDLRDVLKKSGPIDPDRAVELLTQCAGALDAAHAARARPPRREAGEHPDHGPRRRGARIPDRLRSRQAVRHRRRT